MKTVSIIIPVYNVEQYLPQCLTSVINQSYHALQILLIDDGSTDTSGAICDNFASDDSRIVVIHQRNAGAANAKNCGLDQATGDYITFLDSDDYVETTWIERMVEALECSGADVVECNFVQEFVGKTVPGNDESFQPREFTGEEYMAQYLNNWTCSLFWNKLFDAELTKTVRFRRERRCIDDEFYTYKVMSFAHKVVRIDEKLYHYRQRRSGAVMSPKNQLQKTDDALEVLRERYEWILKYYPVLNSVYLKHDIGIMFFFADSFPFEETSVKLFHETSLFFLRECLKGRGSIRLMKDALRLCMISQNKLLSNQSKEEKQSLEEYYG